MKKASPLLFVLTSGATALLTLPALAEEGTAKAGLPQLDFSLFPEQLFWLAVSFAMLYLVMRYIALPGVQDVQNKRSQTIESELALAQVANDQARSMSERAEKALADARAKANASINDIKLQTTQMASEQQTAQAKQLAHKLREAEAGIHANRRTMLQDIESSAGDMAGLIVEQIAGLKVKA